MNKELGSFHNSTQLSKHNEATSYSDSGMWMTFLSYIHAVKENKDDS